MRAGFPHSDIFGSKPVCGLPEAFRTLQRPSSPVIAKASTTCTYSLDPITLSSACAEQLQAFAFVPVSHRLVSHRIRSRYNHNPCADSMNYLESTHFTSSNFLKIQQPLAKSTEPSKPNSLGSVLFKDRGVEVNGIEPMTSCLQSRRSPN